MIRKEDICAEVSSGLPLYVGGDLEPAQAAEIALHLEQCATCDEQAHAAHEARALLVSALEMSERRGPDLWPNVRAVLSENDLIRSQPKHDIASSPASAIPASAREASVEIRNGARTPTAKPRTAPRFLSYAAAAAAALIIGLWLGRAALQSPADGPQTPNVVTVPPHEGPGVQMGGAPIVGAPTAGASVAGASLVPVLDTGSLRPLRHGEAPLSQGARSYFDSPWIDGWASNDPSQATAVGLRHVPRTQ